MEATKKDICDVCHKKTTANRKVSSCKRCKRYACSDCFKEKTSTYLRAGTKVTLTTIITCDICKTEVAMLRKFKESNKLRICAESKIGIKMLRTLSTSTSQQMIEQYRDTHRVLKSREKQQIYQRAKAIILDQKLYSRMQLSQSLFELSSIVAADSREEEQNQKFKHLLMALSINKPLECLRSISQLAHFLTMFLTEQQTYHFITKLYKEYIPECFWARRQEQMQELTVAFKKEFQNDKQVMPYCENFIECYVQAWRSLTANMTSPDVALAIIEYTIQDKQHVIANFNKAMTVVIKAGMKLSNADDDLLEQIARVDLNSIKGQLITKEGSPLKKTQSLDKPLARKTSENISLNQLITENEMLRQENNRLKCMEEELMAEFRQKYLVIMDSLRSDEEVTKQLYIKHEAKLLQEKNQLIEKIVKLNQEIEKLRGDMQKMKECEKYYLQEIQVLQSRLTHAIKNKGDEHYESISPSSMIGDRHEKKKLLLGLIESMDTDFQPPIKIMSKEDVDQLEKDWIAHIKVKLDHHEKIDARTSFHSQPSIHEEEHHMKRRTSKERLDSETTKLLGVLAKKEEKFVLSIYEKDKIIECYEQILWHLENKLQLPNNNIAQRVQNIINTRKIPATSHKKIKEKQKQDCIIF